MQFYIGIAVAFLALAGLLIYCYRNLLRLDKKKIGLIVEGENDCIKLRKIFPHIKLYRTNGLRYGGKMRTVIDFAESQTDFLYILTDPDETGDLIARGIQREYPYIKRIEVDPTEARVLRRKGQYKYGVEYCNEKYLKNLLKKEIPYL